IDAKRESLRRARHIDLGELAVLEQKSVIDSDAIDDVSHQLTLIVASENSCERNARKVNRRKLSMPQYETMRRSRTGKWAVIILPDNVSPIVDPAWRGL